MDRKQVLQSLGIFLTAATMALTGCTGEDGANGVDGINGTSGTDGADGVNGDGSAPVKDFHGTEHLLSSGEFALDVNPKFFAKAAITAATAAVDGTVTVQFTVANASDNPYTGLTAVSANIVKLEPAANGESSSRWVPYIYQVETVGSSGTFPKPAGSKAERGTSESSGASSSNGTLTNNGDGSYTYTFVNKIANVVTPVSNTPVTYNRSRTHRVSIMMGGHSGATADAVFDFVPDGSGAVQTRDIVQTSACKACHGDEFHGHGGNRLTVENCVTCHAAGGTDAQGGESLDMKVMIHKIHAGGELATIPGNDGIVFDDPATSADESADNGEYAIWGYRTTKHEWWKVEFPAIIENCTKCHQGAGADVDNWKNVPSREACGSCHDDVDFATGVNHAGGAKPNDDECSTCHNESLTGDILPSVTTAHDWTQKDERNIPEWDATLTISAPANGSYFVAGESPVVTVQLRYPDSGALINHQLVQDNDGAEGCAPTACPPADGKLMASGLYVHGPRANRVPVLTTTARVEILASGAGPFDLSGTTPSGTFDIIFDGGKDLYDHDTGLRAVKRASVKVPVNGTFADRAAATAAEIMTWLNANSAFAARGIAYIDEATGKLAIRSRNLGDFYSLQLGVGGVTTSVFGGDTAIKVMGGSTVSARLASPTDPKVVQATDSVTYTLDPVDDLQAGTYMVGIEISDRGRKSATDYKTPTVGKARFQVKQAAEELAVANNCDTCHQGPEGTGFVLDFSRHNKIFDHTAVDQCGECHDYQSASALGDPASSDGWNGAKPISRRVHAVHFGSSLNYPLLTVNYSNNDPVAGRNWDITLPQDVRNCEVCHPASETSGTWATKPARTPCSGCHDSDPATNHMKIMTYDLTPANPWSGDEEESCEVCH